MGREENVRLSMEEEGDRYLAWVLVYNSHGRMMLMLMKVPLAARTGIILHDPSMDPLVVDGANAESRSLHVRYFWRTTRIWSRRDSASSIHLKTLSPSTSVTCTPPLLPVTIIASSYGWDGGRHASSVEVVLSRRSPLDLLRALR